MAQRWGQQEGSFHAQRSRLSAAAAARSACALWTGFSHRLIFPALRNFTKQWKNHRDGNDARSFGSAAMNLDELMIVTHEGESEADGSVAKLAGWMGVRTLLMRASAIKRGEDDVHLGLLPPRCAGLAMSADTLAHRLGQEGDSQSWLRLLAEKGVRCLVYGFQLKADHSQLYRRITGSPNCKDGTSQRECSSMPF